MSSSPPISPVSSATGFGKMAKLAPLFADFHAIGPPGEAENRQLCESTFMFGSAWPLEFGKVRFVANVALGGDAGGLYALGPAVCLANQVCVRHGAVALVGSQLLT